MLSGSQLLIKHPPPNTPSLCFSPPPSSGKPGKKQRKSEGEQRRRGARKEGRQSEEEERGTGRTAAEELPGERLGIIAAETTENIVHGACKLRQLETSAETAAETGAVYLPVRRASGTC